MFLSDYLWIFLVDKSLVIFFFHLWCGNTSHFFGSLPSKSLFRYLLKEFYFVSELLVLPFSVLPSCESFDRPPRSCGAQRLEYWALFSFHACPHSPHHQPPSSLSSWQPWVCPPLLRVYLVPNVITTGRCGSCTSSWVSLHHVTCHFLTLCVTAIVFLITDCTSREWITTACLLWSWRNFFMVPNPGPIQIKPLQSREQ